MYYGKSSISFTECTRWGSRNFLRGSTINLLCHVWTACRILLSLVTCSCSPIFELSLWMHKTSLFFYGCLSHGIFWSEWFDAGKNVYCSWLLLGSWNLCSRKACKEISLWFGASVVLSISAQPLVLLYISVCIPLRVRREGE